MSLLCSLSFVFVIMQQLNWVQGTQELNRKTLDELLSSGTLSHNLRLKNKLVTQIFLCSFLPVGRNGMIKFYQPWSGQ